MPIQKSSSPRSTSAARSCTHTVPIRCSRTSRGPSRRCVTPCRSDVTAPARPSAARRRQAQLVQTGHHHPDTPRGHPKSPLRRAGRRARRHDPRLRGALTVRRAPPQTGVYSNLLDRATRQRSGVGPSDQARCNILSSHHDRTRCRQSRGPCSDVEGFGSASSRSGAPLIAGVGGCLLSRLTATIWTGVETGCSLEQELSLKGETQVPLQSDG